jgi:hypothetical protein
MSITQRLRRSAQLCAVACALLVPATTGAAAAAANPTVKERAVAQERYLSSYETPSASAALAQERYLSSYGKPEQLTPPQTPAPSNDTPWLPIALSLAGALAIVAVSATQLRRVRIRRRRAAQTPA